MTCDNCLYLSKGTMFVPIRYWYGEYRNFGVVGHVKWRVIVSEYDLSVFLNGKREYTFLKISKSTVIWFDAWMGILESTFHSSHTIETDTCIHACGTFRA